MADNENQSGFIGLANQTIDDAAESITDGGIGGSQDAFRHALWTSRMRDKYGHLVARLAGGAHEAAGLAMGAPIDETQMDLKNNEVGVRLTKEIKDPAKR